MNTQGEPEIMAESERRKMSENERVGHDENNKSPDED